MSFSHAVGAMRAGVERRAFCRYPVKLSAAQISWQKGSSSSTVNCVVLDVSLKGCRIEAAGISPPPLGSHVCIKFAAGGQGLEGQFVAVQKPWFGAAKLGIRFDEQLSYDLFNEIVYGGGHFVETTGDNTPEHERDLFWK